MPQRCTQQNLTNFEAISLRLEPLAMVNAEILLATKNWAEQTRSALSLTAALVKGRECLLLAQKRTFDSLPRSARCRQQTPKGGRTGIMSA